VLKWKKFEGLAMRRYPTNRYIGVNAHLNSYIQQPNGTFTSFHDKFLNVIQEFLDESLPSNYRAINEKGLQISFIEGDYIEEVNWASKPREPNQPTATFQYSLENLFSDKNVMPTVAIYSSESKITVFEILIEDSKPYKSNYRYYLAKRKALLQAGVNLIEIDILHEKKPILSCIPSYPHHQTNSYPYNVFVNVPQPSYSEGHTEWFAVPIDRPLPQLSIPLVAEESALLDLQAAYNEAYRRVKHYQDKVDYDTLPVNFSAYHKEDQQRIQAMLKTIRQENP
jgi:hypothetical protein